MSIAGKLLRPRPVIAGALALLLGAAFAVPGDEAHAQQRSGDELLIVDCLLPGKVRRLGTRVTYVTARKAVKTTASDCEIRGGEYTSYDRANYATALQIWLPLARDGDAEAQTYLGEIYEKGLGVEPQYDIAAQWYRKAAEQGFSRAQIALGALYEKGLGVPRDPREAMRWFRRASGLADAAVPFIPAPVETELAQLRSEREALSQERERLVAERQDLERERAKLQAELDGVRAELDDARRRLEQRRSQTDESRRLLHAREQELEVLRKKTGTTSAEESRIAELKAELERRRRDLSLQSREMESLRTQVTGLNRDIGRLQVAVQEEAERRETEVGQARDEVNKVRQELAAVQNRQREAAAALERARVDTAAREAELGKLAVRLERERTSSKQDEGRLTALYQELQSREAELDRQRQRIAALTGEVTALSEQATKAKAAERLLQAAIKEEEERRKAEVGEARSEAQQARAELERVLAQRQQAEQALQRAREATLAREAELDTVTAELAQARSSSQRDEGLVAELNAELERREAALAAHRQRTAALSGELDALRTRTAQAEAAAAKLQDTQEQTKKVAAVEPPQIALLDPTVQVTRGSDMPAVQVNAEDKRLIVGKVHAPAGLLALIVNDEEKEAGANGVFKATITLKTPQTPVNIVAIDTEGRRAAMSFALVPKGGSAQARSSGPDSLVKLAIGENLRFGSYHALVIGNNDYRLLPKLKSAVGDAKAVAAVLKQRYGFKTTLLENADRYAILSALNTLREELTESDNLLIYYAGHGELDRVNNRGHWLPVDAEPDSSANWISNIQITDVLNAMAARQVLVVADSCYSGTLTRTAVASLDAGLSNEARLKWIKVMADKRARVVLSSGGVQPVLDQGGGQHSVFAAAFLEVLNGNADILEGQRLYRAVSERVTTSAAAASIEQIPQFAPIKFAGHEAGDFFFVPKKDG